MKLIKCHKLTTRFINSIIFFKHICLTSNKTEGWQPCNHSVVVEIEYDMLLYRCYCGSYFMKSDCKISITCDENFPMFILLDQNKSSTPS